MGLLFAVSRELSLRVKPAPRSKSGQRRSRSGYIRPRLAGSPQGSRNRTSRSFSTVNPSAMKSSMWPSRSEAIRASGICSGHPANAGGRARRSTRLIVVPDSRFLPLPQSFTLTFVVRSQTSDPEHIDVSRTVIRSAASFINPLIALHQFAKSNPGTTSLGRGAGRLDATHEYVSATAICV